MRGAAEGDALGLYRARQVHEELTWSGLGLGLGLGLANPYPNPNQARAGKRHRAQAVHAVDDANQQRPRRREARRKHADRYEVERLE